MQWANSKMRERGGFIFVRKAQGWNLLTPRNTMKLGETSFHFFSSHFISFFFTSPDARDIEDIIDYDLHKNSNTNGVHNDNGNDAISEWC